jgi:hypothetical protein
VGRRRQKATITVRRGEESWSLTIRARQGQGVAVSKQIDRWLDTFAAYWPTDERETLEQRLDNAMREDYLRHPHGPPSDISVDVSDLGTAPPTPGGTDG